MRKYFVAMPPGEIDIYDHHCGRRRGGVAVGVVKEVHGGFAIMDLSYYGVDLGRLDGFADEKDVCPAVFDDKDVRTLKVCNTIRLAA